jgi:hypothetical protein
MQRPNSASGKVSGAGCPVASEIVSGPAARASRSFTPSMRAREPRPISASQRRSKGAAGGRGTATNVPFPTRAKAWPRATSAS